MRVVENLDVDGSAPLCSSTMRAFRRGCGASAALAGDADKVE
jgi:hypothetical protein